MYRIKERQNLPRQKATKTNQIGTLRFGSDTALCNEVTPPFYLQVQFHSKCKKVECNVIRLPSSQDLPAFFHTCIVLNSRCILMLFIFMSYILSHHVAGNITYVY